MATQTLHIAHFIVGLERGGAERVLVDLITQLPQHQHSVLYMVPGPLSEELNRQGIALYQLSAPGSYYNPVFWWKVVLLLKRLRPHVLHTSLWSANYVGRIIGRILNIPTVRSLHTLRMHEGSVRTLLDTITPLRSTHTIAASETIAHSMTTAPAYAPAYSTTIPSGINIEILHHRATAPCQLTHIPHIFTIGAVGRLVPVKQFNLLIESCAQLLKQNTDLRLVIIGSGPEEARLRTLIRAHALEGVISLITQVDSAPYYALFNCLVQPSRYEGLGLTILEALAFNVPVIATHQVQGKHEIITHGETGLLIDPITLAGLPEAVQILKAEPAYAQKLACAGYATVQEKFTVARMSSAYEACFRRIARR